MADRAGPSIYSIAAHRGFADALVAGLIPRYADPETGLARLTLLLPSSRAARTVTEAFVRLSKGGLLLPRMAVVGDLDLDETLGALFDTLGAGGAGDEFRPPPIRCGAGCGWRVAATDANASRKPTRTKGRLAAAPGG